jgi:hypothetical protein
VGHNLYSWQGFPESQFGDQGIQDAMYSQNLYETNAQLDWFVANFPNDNPDYSTAVEWFQNTTVRALCGGRMVDGGGVENLCARPQAALVCAGSMNFTAAMAKEVDAAMDVSYTPGGLHVALHIYDPNGGRNLTDYQVLLFAPLTLDT